MFNSRVSGILLHPTSLPSPLGIGDLGEEAYRFVDFLSESGQQVWQILPLGPTRDENSPYSSYSALAGNPLLISLEKLQEDKLLSDENLKHLPEFPVGQVDYDLVIQTKIPLLKIASNNFKAKAAPTQEQQFKHFCSRQAYWLDDYALFMALKDDQNGASWNQWDEKIAFRKPKTLEKLTYSLREAIFYHQFLQYQFFRQWTNLKKYANQLGITIFGDLSFYVAHDSADVWANPEIFCLDSEGESALMAGVPPDYFSATGQLWGNPVYNWEKLEKTNFQWWVERIEGILKLVDAIRIDHFRGFQAFWAVPGGETTAVKGKWIEAPGEDFFQLLNQKLGTLPIVAEDLGLITPEVEALRDKFNFPGMKVLQFAFDSDAQNPFLPYNYVSPKCVVYTGTHDNNTTIGWYKQRSPLEKARVIDYVGCECPERKINWSLIRLALSSVANGAVFPLQDILGLGSEAKMNTPGTAEKNWRWRYRPEALSSELSESLKHLTILYGRAK
ncbi:MAG TPA: 4-alpha-glucanotransferase [Xenococcaceae cyanobacterium]